jgi:hypothetical protein
MALLADVTSTDEPVGKFLWVGKAPAEMVPFRYALDDRDRRSLDEVAIEELLGLVKEHQTLTAAEDPALALAREIGLARLARGARSRLEEAVAKALGDS